MAAHLQDVVRQIEERGLDLPHSVDLHQAFTKIIRWRPPGEKKKKSAWCRLYEHKGKSGKVYITGVFGVRSELYNVEASNDVWSPAERADWIEARKKAEREAAALRREEAETAAQKAKRIWDRGRTEGRHPYLERKQVGAFGIRFSFNDRFLVPLYNLAFELQGLQYIGPDGEKIFGTGTAKDGHFHLIGEIPASGEFTLGFGEGYATAATAHMASGWPVVVCFDAGNIEPVMKVWREAYPEAEFFIAADDDRFLVQRFCERLRRLGVSVSESTLKFPIDERWELPDGRLVVVQAAWAQDKAGAWGIEGKLEAFDAADAQTGERRRRRVDDLRIWNAGRAKAMAAAKKHRALVALPHFEDGDEQSTDWNDLHCRVGLAAVREQLLAELAQARAAGPARAKGGVGRVAPPDRGAAREEGAGAPFDRVRYLVDRYVLIYGTTTVWDNEARMVVKLDALRAAHRDFLDFWLDAPDRRMVREDQVVFDPGHKHDPAEVVNLFDRFPLEPSNAPCDAIVAHLYHLCHQDDALFHWVACWLAYPLKHPGAKMRTALVLHGLREGTGKSLMMDIMRSIYGRYARTVTQLQLQTEFTDWLSGMLFCVAEEVVTAADRKHHKGLLKNLITNETVQINPKNMPLRQEENHANFAFLSNDQMPMQLDPFDRRYTVINVEEGQPESWFARIGEQRAAGGDAGFYRWLLEYDLQGFNEFTRPFENRDRQRLVTLGMNVDRRFWHFWHQGHTDLPYCCCRASDVYLAFKTWCRLNGERFIPNSTSFGTTLGRELIKTKMRLQVFSDKAMATEDWEAGAMDTTDWQGVVYIVPAADGARPEKDEVQKQCRAFQGAVSKLLAAARRGM